MRGQLSETALSRIEQSLPRPSCLAKIGQLLPESMALYCGPDSDMDIAVVCLRDAADYFEEARLALHECKAGMEWYRVEEDPPVEKMAIFVGRFFADDVALRIYSTAEHVAAFLQAYLGISEDDLEPYSSGRTSKASMVGHYLMEEEPDHEMTKAVKQFIGREECKFALDYRNKWVHDQRPRIADLGMVWKREKRWRKTEKGRTLSFGMGDQPSITVDTLASTMQAALEGVARLLDDTFAVFWETIKEVVDIRETVDGFQVIHTF
ncbi:MAG: hypothetical protein CEE40_10925 [Chloroflexi bacterium B3_Chlor]|nr:MAG: hypothetical protein CEE40_10925 [Chloroflexi bacterium B3_Chlor]